MKLIDTNIVMYALGRAHPLRARCQSLLQRVARCEAQANIDTEVMQEFLYVYGSRGERNKGLRVVEEMLTLFPNPYPIRKDEIVKAKDLMEKYRSLIARDAIHCAVAINSRLEGIITTDRDFKPVKEIDCFKP